MAKKNKLYIILRVGVEVRGRKLSVGTPAEEANKTCGSERLVDARGGHGERVSASL